MASLHGATPGHFRLSSTVTRASIFARKFFPSPPGPPSPPERAFLGLVVLMGGAPATTQTESLSPTAKQAAGAMSPFSGSQCRFAGRCKAPRSEDRHRVTRPRAVRAPTSFVVATGAAGRMHRTLDDVPVAFSQSRHRLVTFDIDSEAAPPSPLPDVAAVPSCFRPRPRVHRAGMSEARSQSPMWSL